ncbi:hypothetical protein DM867_03500 [Halosegnis rubeus]|jgi:hypothetical protein|uniref:Uncharacterized protein n=1 Tax=Halosegnis rubeus TaxID=2212850 RepID=A0A5N5UC13_9EURY|nr:hypothetical protein [Halosegnis rubeus]KAB7515160.1 hypothetical protein DMP03_07880 [Halosegnis rubeus]KAB7516214.1 hypothetical protein DM867_03500 [Halosegnis rubeus]
MSTTTTRPAFGVGTLPLAILGVLATVYGLLVLPASILGGIYLKSGAKAPSSRSNAGSEATE